MKMSKGLCGMLGADIACVKEKEQVGARRAGMGTRLASWGGTLSNKGKELPFRLWSRAHQPESPTYTEALAEGSLIIRRVEWPEQNGRSTHCAPSSNLG